MDKNKRIDAAAIALKERIKAETNPVIVFGLIKELIDLLEGKLDIKDINDEVAVMRKESQHGCFCIRVEVGSLTNPFHNSGIPVIA